MSRFLVACPCGSQLEVSITQAGAELPCSCGRTVLVPTMRALKLLPQAKASAVDAAGRLGRRWSLQNGILFAAGVPIAVIGLAFAGYFAVQEKLFHVNRPDLAKAHYDAEILDFTPLQSLHLFKELTANPLPERPSNEYIAKRDIARAMGKRRNIALWIAGAGVLISTIACLLPKGGAKR